MFYRSPPSGVPYVLIRWPSVHPDERPDDNDDDRDPVAPGVPDVPVQIRPETDEDFSVVLGGPPTA